MALPLTQNIAIYRGDDWAMPVTLATGTTSYSVPINLTGCTISAQIRPTANDASVLGTFVITVTSAANGQFTMSMSGATSGAASWTTGVYDLQVVSGGVSTTYLAGSVTITPDVTR